MNTLDLGAIIGSLLALSLYHLYAYGYVCCGKTKSIQLSRNVYNGLMWVAKHKEKIDAASVTLAIQTLRNTILISVFVGGYAFQYGFIYLNVYSVDEEIEMKTRSIVLSICLLASFLCWVNVIRSASHLGYFMGALEYQEKAFAKSATIKQETIVGNNLSLSAEDKVVAVETRPMERTELEPEALAECRGMMRNMLVSFSLGFRFMFVSIPFIFYKVGPIALIVVTGFMLMFLYSLDHLELKNTTVMHPQS